MSSNQKSESNQVVEGRWDGEEHLRFLAGVMLHGKDWKTVEKVVKTRTGSQVRSHAQKFFIKLTKIARERKKGKNKDLIHPSEIETQILTHFTSADITDNTPSEISALILKDWQDVAFSFSHKKKQTKPPRSASKPSAQQSPHDPQQEEDIFEGGLGQDLLEAMDSNEESFFIKIIKRNKEHFKKGNDFRELIDFGKNHPEETQPSHFHQRKKSFCLPDMEDNSPKLKETLESLHRAMGRGS